MKSKEQDANHKEEFPVHFTLTATLHTCSAMVTPAGAAQNRAQTSSTPSMLQEKEWLPLSSVIGCPLWKPICHIHCQMCPELLLTQLIPSPRGHSPTAP